MCEQAQEQRKRIEELKLAAEEVLRIEMQYFPDSRAIAVDDHLVRLAVAVAAVDEG